jgi:hypothetical protein
MIDGAFRFLVFICLFLLSAIRPWANSGDAKNTETLVSRARQLQALWVDGTPRLRMPAEIQVFAAKGSATQGQYLVDWVSSSNWKEEIRFGGYFRVRVHTAQGYWQKSAVGFQPEVIFEMDQILQIEDLLKIRSEQSFGRVKNHEKDGVRQNCVDVKWPKSTDRTLCFQEANGSLVSVEYPTAENQNPPEISKIEFSDFQVVGEKRIPFEIGALRDRKDITRCPPQKLVQVRQS